MIIRKIIAIVFCLLVILGTVSCAADKKETPTEENEDEESAQESSEFLHQDAFDQMADSFIQAMFLPNISLLLGSIHPDLLAYAARTDGVTTQDLYAKAEEANASITEKWNELDGGASYSDLTYEYTFRIADTARWDDVSSFYAQIPLTLENAVILDFSVFYEEDCVGTFSLGLVLIDGTWWADPILSTGKSAIS